MGGFLSSLLGSTGLAGPLLGAAGSLVGGAMNASSAQAINSQQMQLGIQNATGQFLGPYMNNLVGAAKSAGINPLAALGVSSPGFSGSLGATDPGQGMIAAGKNLSEIGMVDPQHVATLKAQEERKGETEIQALNANLTNTLLQSALNKHTLDLLRADPTVLPDGVHEKATSTSFGIPQANWLIGAISSLLGTSPTKDYFQWGGPGD